MRHGRHALWRLDRRRGKGEGRPSPVRTAAARSGSCPFEPFAWLASNPFTAPVAGVEFERLKGDAALATLARASSLEAFEDLVKARARPVAIDAIRPLESQFLLQHRARLYADMAFAKLRRCQVDIETGSGDGGFSDAARPGDRVLAIGMRQGGANTLLLLEEMTDAAERRLLLAFNERLAALDPDVIEGHNIFKFDLDYLRMRCRMRRVPCAWGRFGQTGHLPEQPPQGGGALDRLSALRPAGARRRRHLPAGAPQRHQRPRAQLLRAEGGGGPFRDHR